ncbi:MAG: glycosyltransferase family 2 protein, partial [bacterium]|nr:glycosyltransferase family 2 protein [bacterium]
LREGLTRIHDREYDDFEVIVAENASKDGSLEMLKSEFPTVKVVELTKNIGVAAVNRAIDVAEGDYVLILDDDSFPADGAIKKMVAVFEKEANIGVVAFDVRNYEKYDEMATTPPLPPNSDLKDKKKYLMGFNGAGGGIRKSSLDKVGGYAEEFFLYWNETDLAIRVLNEGFSIVEFPDIISYHKYSPINRDSARGPYYYTRNLYWVIWKYFPLRKICSITPRLFFYSFYYGMEQGTWVYLKATFNAIFCSRKIWKKR